MRVHFRYFLSSLHRHMRGIYQVFPLWWHNRAAWRWSGILAVLVHRCWFGVCEHADCTGNSIKINCWKTSQCIVYVCVLFFPPWRFNPEDNLLLCPLSCLINRDADGKLICSCGLPAVCFLFSELFTCSFLHQSHTGMWTLLSCAVDGNWHPLEDGRSEFLLWTKAVDFYSTFVVVLSTPTLSVESYCLCALVLSAATHPG